MAITDFSKTELMHQLRIEPDQLAIKSHTVTEKLFCAAILDAGTEITERILQKYHALNDILYEEPESPSA